MLWWEIIQNNFTTTEQSKRLLELGVPADSADCYNTTKHIGKIPEDRTYEDICQMFKLRGNHTEIYPCWSVGRLIEILKECINNEDDLIDIFVELQYSNDILTTILMIFRDNKAILDFSKLEE